MNSTKSWNRRGADRVWWGCVGLTVNLRRVVLDVLKPFEPNIVEMAQKVAEVNGVEGVNSTVYEIDRGVENVKITVEGTGLSYSELKDRVEEVEELSTPLMKWLPERS